MNYLLTPTGWKTLNEGNEPDTLLAAYNKDYENFLKMKIPKGKAARMARKLDDERRRKNEKDAGKPKRGERKRSLPESVTESQMELLESLYEDGYLAEEQIDEILAGLARVASSAAGAAGRGLAGATKRVGSAASAGAQKVAGAAKAGVNAASAGAQKVAGAAKAGARKVAGKVASAYHAGEADAKDAQAARMAAKAANLRAEAGGHRVKAGKVFESQMELLESLYEDGYLSENLLKKALGGIARGAAHVASGAAGVLPIRAGGRRAARAAYKLDNFADRMGEGRGNRINESQVELLESLYEDGYLTEEQLDEILGKIAGVARDIRSGYLQARAHRAVKSSDEKIKKARDALAAIRMSSGEEGIAKAMKNARDAHEKAKLSQAAANRRLDLAIDDMKNREEGRGNRK